MAQANLQSVKLNPGAKPAPAPTGFFGNDFPIIRQASLRLGICLVVSIALVTGSHFFMLKLEAKKLQSQGELAQARDKFAAATTEKNDILDFQPKYIQLVKHGFVGEEKRLDIIEWIQTIQERYQLLPMSYQLYPQQVIALDPSQNLGELELRGSRLFFRLALLHEDDLFRLVDDLGQQGRFIPYDCSLHPKLFVNEGRLPGPLEGECKLFWLTVGRRPAEAAPAG